MRVSDTRHDLTAELESIPAGMIEAWNRGDAAGFVAAFAPDAEFVAFEGTILHGTDAIIAFHQPLFDTLLRGSRLVSGGVPFVRVFDDRCAVVHNRVAVILPGEAAPSPSRNSMETFTVVRGEDGWRVVASQNSRVLTLEHQALLDGIDALPDDVAKSVSALVDTLAASTRTRLDA
jgi:uncharacterized protein (TIGR02246 family)